jgi:NADH dehydrogenase [ubiquinone] 1 alpha subcomplex assembly factor 5
MADELSDRLAYVTREFENILILGPVAAVSDRILRQRAGTVTKAPLQNEEILPFAAKSYDLILSAGTLDSVNDLPGALIQIRHALKPDGLFLGTLYGAGSLQMLKQAMMRADGDQVRAHIHPQIDLRAASDLLMRAGFALPVADMDKVQVRYSNWRSLVRDVRAAGAGNAMAGPRGFNRALPAALDQAWQILADADGRVSESFHFLQLSGWAPSPSQPKPAARGSGTVSLADALKQQR